MPLRAHFNHLPVENHWKPSSKLQYVILSPSVLACVGFHLCSVNSQTIKFTASVPAQNFLSERFYFKSWDSFPIFPLLRELSSEKPDNPLLVVSLREVFWKSTLDKGKVSFPETWSQSLFGLYVFSKDLS